jgi:WD40 repeat protein
MSGSYDRNIFIWNFVDNKWVPELVVFSQKGSILDVKWSARGDKFSVATGSKLVSTGYYEDDVNWWTCKSMKGRLIYFIFNERA